MSTELLNRSFLFFNIIPYSPGKEKETAADILDYAEKTGNDIALYSLSFHPEGVPAMRKVREMLESYRKLKAELAGSNVKLGILLQSILGHWPRVDKELEPWTRSVNVNGDPVRFCILDENFRKYIFDAAAMIAAEKPVFLLGDDDIRGFSPLAECFCQRHTAEFNARTGNNFTPEQYQEAVRNAQPGDAVNTAFEQLCREIPETTASLIRQGLDSVDPSIPAGSCMPGWEYRFNGRVSKKMAAAGQAPVMRVCNADYHETSAKNFPAVVSRTIALRKAHSDIPIVFDESDTFPHTLYSRSSRSMHAKLCASIFAGLRGAKLWLVNMKKLGRPVHKNYTEILGKYNGFYQSLAAEVRQSRSSGIVIPTSRSFPHWNSAVLETVYAHFLPTPALSVSTLGILGIPFDCDFDLGRSGVYALAGKQTVERFSDDELKKMLSGKLYVDGPAAAALCDRGFADLLGVKAELIDFRFNRERNPVTKQFYAISKAPGIPHLTLLDPAAEVLTTLCYAPFIGAEPEEVSPATVFFRNALGGMVCTSAFHQGVPNAQGNEPRKEWYLEIFDKLNGSKLPAVCQDLQDITALSREHEDGSLLLLVCNINFDRLEELAVRCAKLPGKILRLTPGGKWEECSFTVDGETVFIGQPMNCYDLEVFKFI